MLLGRYLNSICFSCYSLDTVLGLSAHLISRPCSTCLRVTQACVIMSALQAMLCDGQVMSRACLFCG